MKKTILLFQIIVFFTFSVSAQSWQTYTVKNGSAKNTGLLLDQQKRPHVFYYSPNTFGEFINHSYWDGTTWVHETIGGSALIHNDGPSAAIDSEGKIHVAYFDDNFNLAYATLDETWQIEIVDVDDNTGD